ncbi:MAG: T9SS type A sorting domain-containing protein [Flavobacteriaceae bacterium]|nr:T9SS type A sorting domain-containing protein [Flavobacteriaceae bacterium]
MKKLLLFIVAALFFIQIKAQTHTIEIHSQNRTASLLMSPAEYASWKNNDDFNNSVIREALFQDVYQKFDDDFDFIFLILNEDTRPNNLPFGQLMQVSNTVTGIGISIYDETANYGSAGKLQAVMHLTQKDYLRNGPSLHELMHNWGNFGIPTESVNAPGTNLNSFNFQPHWGFTGGNTPGQLGGFAQASLIDNGGGSYTVNEFGPNANGGNAIPYNELELYLMGMTPVSSVSNFDVFTDITSLSINLPTFDFEDSTRTTYTPASLVALLGARVPNVAITQKDFKLLTITLTDTPLTPAEFDAADVFSEEFGRNASDGWSSYNFWEATNGLGTIETGNLQNNVLAVSDVNNNNNNNNNNITRIYPNPATDKITIEFNDSSMVNQEISIYNLVGQKVNTLLSSKSQNKQVIDLSKLPSGIYFIQFVNKQQQMVTKKISIK